MVICIVVSSGFLISTSLTMTRPAAALYSSQIGMSVFEIGMLVAAFSLVPVLIAIRTGMIADKVGDRLPIIAGALVTSAGFLLPPLLGNGLSLFASQVLVGIGQLVMATSLQNLVGNSSTSANRDKNFALFATCVSAGGLVGPFIGGVVAEQVSYLAVFTGGALISLCSGIIGIFLSRRPPSKPSAPRSSGSSLELLRSPSIQRAIMTGTLIQYSRDIFLAYFPLYGQHIGLSPFEIGLTLSLQGGSMLLARALVPTLLRFWSRDVVLLCSVCFSGIAFIAVPLTSLTIVTHLAGVLMGFALGAGQPISMTETFNASPEGRTGEVLGLRMTALRLGQFVAPLFFGAIGSSLGILAIFFVNGALLLGGGYAVKRRGVD